MKTIYSKVTRALVEEIVMSLAIICSILCFGFGFKGWGYVFAIKAFFDFICTVVCAYKEILANRIKEQEGL